jgi:hypothetical protein
MTALPIASMAIDTDIVLAACTVFVTWWQSFRIATPRLP